MVTREGRMTRGKREEEEEEEEEQCDPDQEMCMRSWDKASF